MKLPVSFLALFALCGLLCLPFYSQAASSGFAHTPSCFGETSQSTTPLFQNPGYPPCAAQEELSHALLRLHIVANSDTAADQAVKLKIRDAILHTFQEDFSAMPDKQHALMLAHSLLQQAEETANRILQQEGFSETAHAAITRCAFPEKTYGRYTFPAGTYDALRITIGKAEGHNWWCVLYPPLCFDDLSSPMPKRSDSLLRQTLSNPTYQSLFADPDTFHLHPALTPAAGLPFTQKEAAPDSPKIQFRFFPFLNRFF